MKQKNETSHIQLIQEIEFIQKKLDILINDNIKRSNDTIIPDFLLKNVYRIVRLIACLIALYIIVRDKD